METNKNKNVTLSSYLANVRWANSEDLQGATSIPDFIAKMKDYKSNGTWCVTLWEEKYGPNIHVVIEAGNDAFTISSDGMIENNPATDIQHYYVTARVLGNRNGPFDDVLDTVWVDEDYPEVDKDQAREIYHRLMKAARDYIQEQVNQPPTQWCVELQSRDGGDNPCFHVNFKSYKKAKAFFDERVAYEKNPNWSWVGDIYEDYKDLDNAPDYNYKVIEGEHEFTVTNNEDGTFVSWTLTKEAIF